jgi:hypothetical protein
MGYFMSWWAYGIFHVMVGIWFHVMVGIWDIPHVLKLRPPPSHPRAGVRLVGLKLAHA